MRTQDLFKNNRSAKKLSESLQKTFGKKLNLESFETTQLEDARNKLRTQVSQARSQSGFNENLENDALHQAQWMLDAINSEIAERAEHIVDESEEDGLGQDNYDKILDAIAALYGDDIWDNDSMQDLANDLMQAGPSDKELDFIIANGKLPRRLADTEFTDNDSVKFGEATESIQTELSKNTLKSYQDKAGKDIVNTMTSGDYMTTDKSSKKVTNRLKGSERANSKIDNKNESINTGEDMRNLREGEIQQASAIVTAKTMVDRVGRWIEELSGMENETLLQLGDSIRDEMGQEQAKAFISAVAPAIQQALENLKNTRDTLSTGVRALASGEAPDAMLGADPAADMGGEMGDELGDLTAEPDAMNAEPMAGAEDDFSAAEPAAGPDEAGRAQRESIDRGNNLLRVLAG